MNQEDHQEIKLRSFNGKERRHGKDCAGLVGRFCKLFAQIVWLPQSPDSHPLDISLWAHFEENACKTRHSNANELKVSVTCA